VRASRTTILSIRDEGATNLPDQIVCERELAAIDANSVRFLAVAGMVNENRMRMISIWE
jgi:hypothetical protein